MCVIRPKLIVKPPLSYSPYLRATYCGYYCVNALHVKANHPDVVCASAGIEIIVMQCYTFAVNVSSMATSDLLVFFSSRCCPYVHEFAHCPGGHLWTVVHIGLQPGLVSLPNRFAMELQLLCDVASEEIRWFRNENLDFLFAR